jgi:hypothetical protein
MDNVKVDIMFGRGRDSHPVCSPTTASLPADSSRMSVEGDIS